jgi:hypothetical protein
MTLNEFQEAILLGKSRSDCSSGCIDLLVEVVATHKRAGIAGDIAECGSYRCGATIAMAAAVDYHEAGKRVFAFDTWCGLPYGPEQQGFENFADVNFTEVCDAVERFEIDLIRGRHEDTVPPFAAYSKTIGRKFSLLFMDSDFYDSHLTCLRSFWPLITRRGGVVFHDWTFQGVQQAIEDAVDEKEYNRYDLPNNMGMIVKHGI